MARHDATLEVKLNEFFQSNLMTSNGRITKGRSGTGQNDFKHVVDCNLKPTHPYIGK